MADVDPSEDQYQAAPAMEQDEEMDPKAELGAEAPPAEEIEPSDGNTTMIIRGIEYQNIRESAVNFGDHIK